MKPVDILKGALALLERPKGWTRGKPARRSNRQPTFYRDPKAVCFCTIGAVFAASPSDDRHSRAPSMASHALAATLGLQRGAYHRNVTAWNDGLRPNQKAVVLTAFRDTIARLEGIPK